MKIVFTFFFIVLSTFAFSQQSSEKIDIDDRLFAVYDADYLERLQTTNPILIQRWNFYLENAWFIADLPEEKKANNDHVITIADLEHFNIFLLEKQQGLKRDWEKHMMYSIEGTDKMLVYYPGKEFVQKLNQHLGRSH